MSNDTAKRKFLEEQRRIWHPDVARKYAGEDDAKGERFTKKFLEVHDGGRIV